MVIKSKMMSFMSFLSVAMVSNIFSVFCDNGVGVRMAADHLISRGRKRICYFQDTYTYSGFCKTDGYKSALKNAGFDFDAKRFITTERGLEGGSRAVDTLIESKVGFDAIMTGEDITALGAVKRLKALGYHVPGKVAVVGFNNSIFSQCSDPELTTVDTKMEERLSLAVRLLNEVLEGKEVPPQTLFLPELLIKHSS